MATDLANNATRQQLDELDSLLQKMLGVPGNEASAQRPADKPKKTASTPAPSAKVTAPNYLVETPSSPSMPPPAPPTPAAANGWAIDLNPRNSSSVLGDRSPLAGAMPPLTQTPPPSPAAQLQLQTLAPPVTATSSRRRNRVPLLMRPFAAVTEQFDDAVAVLGPIGRLVSSSFVRALMGLSGLIMLVGSGAWFAMVWFGWSR